MVLNGVCGGKEGSPHSRIGEILFLYCTEVYLFSILVLSAATGHLEHESTLFTFNHKRMSLTLPDAGAYVV